MSYDDEVCKICRLQNGWEVEIYDPTPKEGKAEKKAESKGYISSYHSGWRSFAFTTEKELIKFLGSRLSGLKPRNYDEDYQSAFDAGVASEMPKTKK